ncbi:DUF308 domain-containing protein [Mycobacterium deserti]|uniref:DUF308 domain-containing protein n=1 Tax=Mycobacterium deserti TaxID=2978347 RepID=A0ABT2MD25_9MYCO|nr:DUF308 domain-containing protein [Mycobacterium deserti]MCT7660169.1 DUF308 domain-containing protein [Mycobacterium deserti]
MLIVALVLAVIGLAALVTAVATSNELIAWVCIGASVLGVVLLIVDAVRDRSRGQSGAGRADDQAEDTSQFDEEYPEEVPADESAEAETTVVEQADDEVPQEDRNR